jgi:hypothetical protein
MSMSQVFISYRRDDAAGYARALYDELARQFGAERVFMDVDDIGAGQAFGEVIERQLGAAQVMLVLIGRRWLGEREGAPARIHDEADFVRREVATGLARGARVIPVLLDGAPLPSAAQLPEALLALPGRNALEIDNSRYAADVQRLVTTLREALSGVAVAAPPQRLRRAALAGAILVAGGAAVWWSTRGSAKVRPAVNGLWQADVTYDWPNARYSERLELRGDDTALHGSASFLTVPRGVLEGQVDGAGLRFVTRSTETSGGGEREVTHRYRGHLVGDELHLVMQTEGGSTPHAPLEIVARRGGAAR